MNKIYKLFINENIKTWKKFATKLLIVIVLLALIGSMGLVKFIKYMNGRNDITYNSATDWKTSAKEEKQNLSEAIQNDVLDKQLIESYKAQIEKIDMALEENINPYSSYWKSELLNQILEAKMNNLGNNVVQELTQVLKSDDYTKYIEFEKDKVKKSLEKKDITQQEYNDKIIILDLKAKKEIGKTEEDKQYWQTYLISKIENAQSSVRTGVDYKNNNVLTLEEKQKYEEEVLIGIYSIENDIAPLEFADSTGNYRIMFESIATGFVMAMIGIFAIIIAGGVISTEHSSGTIKFWALTPNKRWKILLSKTLSVMFYIVTLTLIMAILTVICGELFFEGNGTQYMYVKDGTVTSIGSLLLMIELYFAKSIPVIIFALFAIMISTVTRNTAVAVSFGVATYIGNGIAMAIINQFIKKDWVKFIPFNNLNIADKIFPNMTNMMSMTGNNYATSTSLWFSLGVLGVCAVLMIVTMHDSFNHKDII
ncbi:MAG: ABC transporter permease subunit [Clostridia bacterium]|nr:ABC transporter permease subunit [Clostridia bacterium]